MHIEFIECDGCHAKQQIDPPQISGHGTHWITVAKTSSMSGEKLSAGLSHFCSEACLTRVMNAHPRLKEAELPLDGFASVI